MVEIPKSESFKIPCFVQRMLCGLMSLWITFFEWMYFKANSIWAIIRLICVSLGRYHLLVKLDLGVFVFGDLLAQVSIVGVLQEQVEFLLSHCVGDQLDDVRMMEFLENFYFAENLGFTRRVFDGDLFECVQLEISGSATLWVAASCTSITDEKEPCPSLISTVSCSIVINSVCKMMRPSVKSRIDERNKIKAVHVGKDLSGQIEDLNLQRFTLEAERNFTRKFTGSNL